MYLAVDLGSTSFKTGVFDQDLNALATGSSKLNYQYPDKNHVELSFDDVNQAIKTCLTVAMESAGISETDVQAIAVTSQAQTSSIFSADGSARTPFVSWLDRRAEATKRDMEASGDWEDFQEHTSLGALSSASPLCVFNHMKKQLDPPLAEDDVAALLPAYFMKTLCGEYLVDSNLAVMSGFFSVRRNDWWDKALRLSGLSERQMPKLVACGSVVAETNELAAEYGLLAGIPVVSAGNDQTAGAYGAEIHKQSAVLVTLGTAHVVYAVRDQLGKFVPKVIRGNYPNGKFYEMITSGRGGNVVDWAKSVIVHNELDDPDSFIHLAGEAEPGCGGLVFEPEVLTSSGAWRGISVTTTRADLARSVWESLLRRVADMIRRVCDNHVPETILVAGGGGKAPLVREILSDLIQRPVERTDADPLLGAARMAIEAVK